MQNLNCQSVSQHFITYTSAVCATNTVFFRYHSFYKGEPNSVPSSVLGKVCLRTGGWGGIRNTRTNLLVLNRNVSSIDRFNDMLVVPYSVLSSWYRILLWTVCQLVCSKQTTMWNFSYYADMLGWGCVAVSRPHYPLEQYGSADYMDSRANRCILLGPSRALISAGRSVCTDVALWKGTAATLSMATVSTIEEKQLQKE